MTETSEYMRAVDMILEADPDTRHGAIAVLLAGAINMDSQAMVEIGLAMRLLQHINEERSCAH